MRRLIIGTALLVLCGGSAAGQAPCKVDGTGQGQVNWMVQRVTATDTTIVATSREDYIALLRHGANFAMAAGDSAGIRYRAVEWKVIWLDGKCEARGDSVPVPPDTLPTPPDTTSAPPDTTSPPPTTSGSLTPSDLFAAMGPLVAPVDTGMFATFDNRYRQAEPRLFQKWLATENDPGGAYLDGNHYGGLRSRLSYAIRHGEPYGPGITDESQYAYARGVRIVRRYLAWAKQASGGYNFNWQFQTGLADVEALYVLEGDPDALTLIHCRAAYAASPDTYGYVQLTNASSGPRIPAVSLEAINAALRLGVPYSRCPVNVNFTPEAGLGSWRAAGDRIVDWIGAAMQADGSLPARSNGSETFFMDAMVATQLLRWFDLTGNQKAYDLAVRGMDFVIGWDAQSAVPRGWRCLPYLANSGNEACDLAGFYVWPALALWQDTGDPKYRAFALRQFASINTMGTCVNYVKQFNQCFSLPQNVEALLSGVSWRW